MTGNSIALDTNQAIHVLNDDVIIVDWLNTFSEVCLPVTVLGELKYGAMNSGRPQSNLDRVGLLVARCRILDTCGTTADFYARLRLDLLRKGRPIPENDIWIAASCREHGLPLATGDAHFGAVEGLRVLRGP